VVSSLFFNRGAESDALRALCVHAQMLVVPSFLPGLGFRLGVIPAGAVSLNEVLNIV
jgi:hypothetical protein